MSGSITFKEAKKGYDKEEVNSFIKQLNEATEAQLAEKDAKIQEADLQGTIESVRAEVERFKAEHEKGAVILMSHMGARLSEMVQKNVPQIYHILNGHDHKNVQSNIGTTSIDSLGQDLEMLKSLTLEFDDKGDLVKSTMTPYFPATTLADGLENHPFQEFLDETFEEDVKPLVSLKELKKEIRASLSLFRL